MTALAVLFCGYSLFCALSLAVTHFGGAAYRERPQVRVMGLVLLLALSGLQAVHFAQLSLGRGWVGGAPYRMLLFAVAPSFFWFARPLLEPGAPVRGRWLHFVPVLVAAGLPAPVAGPAAFVVGAGYLLWLGRRLLALRQERERFAVEMGLLGVTFVVAVGVAVLGLLPVLSVGQFLSLYSSAIGVAFLLVQISLGLRPQLPVEVAEAVQEVAEAAQPAQERYVNTTLAKVDCEAALTRLDALMTTGRLFTDADLTLSALAQRLDLSAHQLSELLNSRLGKGFARYLRELRVAAARTLLRDTPAASVLSVGMSVGFTSQSSFYEAFREIEGMTPGQYRKLHPRGGA